MVIMSALSSPDLIVGDDGLARPPWAAHDPLLRAYYDTEWGLPVHDDDGVFERLSLEGFQAGLSWATILRKREAFREDFHRFNIDACATLSDADVFRLMSDERIVRNLRKITAVRQNAQAAQRLREDGGLAALVWSFQPECTPAPMTLDDIPSQSTESVAMSQELRRRGFTFVGPRICFALMEALGIIDTHLMGSHRRGSSGVWDDKGRRR